MCDLLDHRPHLVESYYVFAGGIPLSGIASFFDQFGDPFDLVFLYTREQVDLSSFEIVQKIDFLLNEKYKQAQLFLLDFSIVFIVAFETHDRDVF